MTVSELHVSLDVPLPAEIEVGGGTALFVGGTCYSPQGALRSLSLVVCGETQRLSAFGMPRLDFFRTLHPGLEPSASARIESDPNSEEDPLMRAYRSGFWGMAVIRTPADEGECALELRGQLFDGREVRAELPGVRIRGAPLSPPLPASGPAAAEVAICMATYEPPLDLFKRQVESIRAQSHEDWVCYISDDCSSPQAFAGLQRVVDDDPRFIVSRSSSRIGFYRNFERALRMVPPRTPFVALADQDDRWHQDKLSTLIGAIDDAQLIYSDARIVSRDGTVISNTYWSTRRNNHSDMTALLVANAVSGAASLMRGELLGYALPFPPEQFAHFHDHWLGLTALALGRIAFVDRPLYDYVQHGDASLGHAAANRMTPLRDRLRHGRGLRERVRMWRLHYFVDVCRLRQVATILELRCAERLTPSKRRALRRFIDADRSLAPVAVLGARGVRELLSSHSQTLGAEWMLFLALVWRRLLAASARERPQRRFRLDAVPPPTLALRPARETIDAAAAAVAQKIAPLDLTVTEGAPERINLLIPTIDIEHFFGGYITKLNLARRLAELGARIRIVTVDPVGPLPPNWKRKLESYEGLTGLFDRVEVAFGRAPSRLEVSSADSFIATTWWSAHIAADAMRRLGGGRFVYLVQEYEPLTFAMGSYAALAEQSYAFEHFGLFSSELLREYFRRHEIGVFAGARAAGDEMSVSFQNAITNVPPPRADELRDRGSRRLLFYARPERHAARNMFELGLLALARTARDGLLDGWELHGVGSVGPRRTVSVGEHSSLELLPRRSQDEYARLLRGHDVGLALMHTPHPSLVPIEMAAAGMLAVTNSFENKTPETMALIAENMITMPPTIEGVAEGLRAALAGAGDYERRVQGSRVNWSRSWEDSFDDRLLARVMAVLVGQPALRP